MAFLGKKSVEGDGSSSMHFLTCYSNLLQSLVFFFLTYIM